jgi:ADP-ribose pyrophosphatase YjhB (NUDIX family)
MSKYKYCYHCGSKYSKFPPAADSDSSSENNNLTCQDCQTVVYRNPTPVAVCLIPVKDQDEIGLLLVERKIGELGWGLPGGFMEFGEDLNQAGARELFEETNIEISADSAVGNDSVSTPDGSKVLIFIEFEAISIDKLNDFTENDEVGSLKVVWGQDQIPSSGIIFPLHAMAAEAFFSNV